MKVFTIRKSAIAASAAAILALVSACSSGSTSSSAAPSASSGAGISAATSGTVRVLMEGVPDTDIVQGLLAEFNKQYPNITVKIQSIVYDQIRDKIVASFQAPTPTYDMAIIDNPWMGDFAKAGFLKPLDTYIKNTPNYDYQDFSAPLRSIGEVDGKIYGVPFYNYGLGLIYRTDLFQAAGLSEPTTLAELASDAKTLTTPTRAGIAMQPQRGYKAFEEWGNYLDAAGGSIYGSDGKVHLNTPEAKLALNTYIQMYKTSAPKNSLNWAFDEALRAVSSDKAAMMVSYNWMLPTLNKPGGPAGALAGKFKLATMPGGKQILGLWDWAIPSNSKVSDAAWAFISWLTSKQGEAARVAAGGAPVRTSVLTDPAVASSGGGADYFATVGKILSNAEPLCHGSNCDEMINAVGTELNAAIAGQKSVDAALLAAETQANKIQSQ
ncbi:MAG TPA: sugar ABC transporter substrate-binding protein [Candidatus Nanopelagicaceae bacterium]|nr:sugar ABC transporter substrate-binding protein [Candidatus Nanopelagicaceae bacterium]